MKRILSVVILMTILLGNAMLPYAEESIVQEEIVVNMEEVIEEQPSNTSSETPTNNSADLADIPTLYDWQEPPVTEGVRLENYHIYEDVISVTNNGFYYAMSSNLVEIFFNESGYYKIESSNYRGTSTYSTNTSQDFQLFNSNGICVGAGYEEWIEVGLEPGDGGYEYRPIINVGIQKGEPYYLYSNYNYVGLNIEKLSELGTENNPYLIDSEDELLNMESDKHYMLNNDLDFSDRYLGSITNILNEFSGSFNGNNHKISFGNNSNLSTFIGTNKGKIKNLSIVNTTFKGANIAGISYENKGDINNCYVNATLNATNYAANKIGGISANNVGYGRTINCVFIGEIIEGVNIYGISDVKAENCYYNINNYNSYASNYMPTSDFQSIYGTYLYLNDEEMTKYCYADSSGTIREISKEQTTTNEFLASLGNNPIIKNGENKPVTLYEILNQKITMEDWIVDGELQDWFYNLLKDSYGDRWAHINNINKVTGKDLYTQSSLSITGNNNYKNSTGTKRKLPPIFAKLSVYGNLNINLSNMDIVGQIPEGAYNYVLYGKHQGTSFGVNLNLSGNKLTSTVPEQLLKSKITSLNISNNMLLGKINKIYSQSSQIDFSENLFYDIDYSNKNVIDPTINFNNNFFSSNIMLENLNAKYYSSNQYSIQQKSNVNLNTNITYALKDIIEVKKGFDVVNKDISQYKFKFEPTNGQNNLNVKNNFFQAGKNGIIEGIVSIDYPMNNENLQINFNAAIANRNYKIDYRKIATGNEFTILEGESTKDNGFSHVYYSFGNNRLGQISNEGLEHQEWLYNYNVVNSRALIAGYNHYAYLPNEFPANLKLSGDNRKGQLGIPKTTESGTNENTMATLDDFVEEVYIGGDNTFLKTQSAEIFAFGANQYGQIGDGTYEDRFSPINITNIIPGEKIKSVVAGAYFTHFLTESGKIYSCGSNLLGQIAQNENINFETPFENTSFPQNIKEIKAGMHNTVILTNDGKVFSVGSNKYGQLGLPEDITYSNEFVEIATDIKKIFVGQNNLMLLSNNEKLYGLGQNDYDQLAIESMPKVGILTEITHNFVSEQIADIKLGMFSSFATTKTGAIYAFGYNKYGQLGTKTKSLKEPPTIVACNSDRISYINYEITVPQPYVVKPSMDKINYQLKGDFYYKSKDENVIKVDFYTGDIISRAEGATDIYIIPRHFYKYINVNNLDIETTIVKFKVIVKSSNKMQLEVGNSHTVLLTDTNKVYTWGNNRSGQLGIGDPITQKRVPQDITSKFGNQKIISVKVGFSHSIALSETGTVYAFGDNAYGQIGNGTTTKDFSPINITSRFGNEKIVKIYAKGNQSFAISETNKVYAWGFNKYGQLGDGTNINRLVPTEITGNFPKKVIEIFPVGYFTYAKLEDGSVYGFGNNNQGQLGKGDNVNTNIPVLISFNGESITKITGGMHHAVAVTQSGKLLSWGYNIKGQLGDGTLTSKNMPQDITSSLNGEFPIDIFAGLNSIAVLTNENNVYISGELTDLMIGNSFETTMTSLTKQTHMTSMECETLGIGTNFTVMITQNNFIFSCGNNVMGQLGTGLFANEVIYKSITDMLDKEEELFTNKTSTQSSINVNSQYITPLSVSNVESLGNKEFIITYNPQQLEVLDLCGLTKEEDKSLGVIPNTKINITLIDTESGILKFKYEEDVLDGKVFNGFVNTIKFKGLIDGNAEVAFQLI